jgi:hypothetical protein
MIPSHPTSPFQKPIPPWDFLNMSYDPKDNLAFVVKNNATGQTQQRILPAGQAADHSFQKWLRYRNLSGFDIYVSMNALSIGARQRTKSNLSTIRHLYLDVDQGGNVALSNLLDSADIPMPTFVTYTSPGKFQVSWEVEGFQVNEAEDLQRKMVRVYYADPAAVDASRVLRLPGFYNRKYSQPFRVTCYRLNAEKCCPKSVQEIMKRELPTVQKSAYADVRERKISANGLITQSERDWAYVKKHLALGADPASLIVVLADRRKDKPNPAYYARLTVEKAMASLQLTGTN